MKALRWTGVVTDRGHFVADDHKTFRAFMQALAGDPVEVIVRNRRPQSARKRGYFHAEIVPAFRAWLEDRFRDLVEAFRADYGEFTLEHARDVLVRCVMNLPEDVERVSTAIDAMDDVAYEDFLFRVMGFLVNLGVEVEDAERDPVRRFERTAKKGRAA